jgi:hypothetical protein
MNAPATFTVHLLRLECLRSQELDGDEPYLLIHNELVWSTPRGDHMVRAATKPGQFSVVDFSEGRRLMHTGWSTFGAVYDPSLYRLPKQTGFVEIRLMEADRLTSDDHFGLAVASLTDVGRGDIQVNFTEDGAEYLLVYRVELDESSLTVTP